MHNPCSQSCRRGEDTFHEQRARRVQGREGLRCTDDDERRSIRVLQRLRAQLHAVGILEHRPMDHVRAIQDLREEDEGRALNNDVVLQYLLTTANRRPRESSSIRIHNRHTYAHKKQHTIRVLM
ncbi:hypothetical protein ANTPLA_LOCUS2166, partial [Anthophora plagiata]